MKSLIVGTVLSLSTFSAFAQERQGPTEPAYLYRAEVVRVIDGDTIVADIDLGFYTWLHTQHIRMVGINAPEPRGAEKAAGVAASEFLKGLIVGKTIIIRTYKANDGGDQNDQYGRWLGRVFLEGMDINQYLIDSGHAVPAE